MFSIFKKSVKRLSPKAGGLAMSDSEAVVALSQTEKKLEPFTVGEKRVLKAQMSAMRRFQSVLASRIRKWNVYQASYDEQILNNLEKLRELGRDLAKNDDYAKRFLNLLKTNVVGPKGISLQATFKNKAGDLDKELNDKIEKEFLLWSKKGSCEITGKHSFRAVQQLVLKAVARDGEAFVSLVYGEDAGNPWNMTLQLLNSEQIDQTLNVVRDNGNRIVMGVEIDSIGRPLAYWIKAPQNVPNLLRVSENNYTRIEADSIIHLYVQDHMQQTRGVTWLASQKLPMISSYMESELIAARSAACKMGFYVNKNEDTSPSLGDNLEELYPGGPLAQEAHPGALEELPPGYEIQSVDWKHPVDNFDVFLKTQLRAVASNYQVSYNSLANDYESTNYSSMRAALLDERDHYKDLQTWMIENFCEPVYQKWLQASILSNRLRVKTSDMDRLKWPSFVPRTFAWVDPLRDVKASLMSIQGGLKSKTEVIREQGRLFEDVAEEISNEHKLERQYGIFRGVENIDLNNAPGNIENEQTKQA